MKSQKPTYTHKGLFCGIVPVYLDMTDEAAPLIAARHWSLEHLLDVVELLFGCCIYLRTMVDADYEPAWPIRITGDVQ